jgi:hypothetical protein
VGEAAAGSRRAHSPAMLAGALQAAQAEVGGERGGAGRAPQRLHAGRPQWRVPAGGGPRGGGRCQPGHASQGCAAFAKQERIQLSSVAAPASAWPGRGD